MTPGLTTSLITKQVRCNRFVVRCDRCVVRHTVQSTLFLSPVEVWYSDKNKTKVVRYDDCGDSAAWTGLYLAALSHKYNVTGDARVLVGRCCLCDLLLLLFV